MKNLFTFVFYPFISESLILAFTQNLGIYAIYKKKRWILQKNLLMIVKTLNYFVRSALSN
jgi:hypothetical protein